MACCRKLRSPLRTALSTCVILFFATLVVFASQISLPNQSAAPGASVLVPVVFAAQASSVSGVQFDLQYDNSALGLSVTLGDPARTSGKSIYVADLAPSKKRILIVGLNQNPIPDGTLLNLFVNVNGNASEWHLCPDALQRLRHGSLWPDCASHGRRWCLDSECRLGRAAGAQRRPERRKPPCRAARPWRIGNLDWLRNRSGCRATACRSREQHYSWRDQVALRWRSGTPALCCAQPNQRCRALRRLRKNRNLRHGNRSRPYDSRAHSDCSPGGSRHLHARLHRGWSQAPSSIRIRA